jgi:hypothetical protein
MAHRPPSFLLPPPLPRRRRRTRRRDAKFGATIIRTGEEGPWAPGYYSTLFEDPDGIRIEALFIPGSGNLDRIKDAPLAPII